MVPKSSQQPLEMQYYKASTTTNTVPENMAANAPVKVGTRGTVGSLVIKEIEYFRNLELAPQGNSQKPQAQIVGTASSSSKSHSRPSFWFLIMTWKRKRRRGSGFLPSICSVVEVAETNRLKGTPGFNYRILKNDVKNYRSSQ